MANRIRRVSAVALFAAVLGVATPASVGGVAIASADNGRRNAAQPRAVSVTVTEGTSMAVSASPDGRSLAIDLQGGIWTLPMSGGTATRVTDEYNDARQPAWSPDGQRIAFQGYRDGGYDIWAVAPDGSGLHQLTWGPYDDREPAWSHDGKRLAFSSDRGDAGNYNIWTLDIESHELRQVSKDKADDYMPTWAADDREIAYVSNGNGEQGVYASSTGGLNEHKVVVATAGRIDAPSWGPTGALVYHTLGATTSQLVSNGKTLTGDENAFPFRVSWVSDSEFVYVSDGKIRKRSLSGGSAQTIPFSATLTVTPASYTKRKRDFDSRAPRRALGIVRPTLSPDAKQVVFAALGDIYVMPIGGKPINITSDPAFDTDPSWSPDGSQIVWASDRGGRLMDLWIYFVRSRTVRRLTNIPTSTLGPSYSPDGKRIAFLDVDGIWGRATPSVVDVATGAVSKLYAPIFAPGNPTWSADGLRIAMAALTPYSTRFREGTNQVLTFGSMDSTDAKAAAKESSRLTAGMGTVVRTPPKPPGTTTTAASVPRVIKVDPFITPVKHLSIDSRVGAGPAWSPDGTRMAVIYEGLLSVVPVATDGTPLGPPRRFTTEMAHAPSWSADGRHVLYQSMDKLRLLDVESGATSDVPVDLMYTQSIPTDRVVVHAGTLVDGKSSTARTDMDITVVGNRITAVAPHSAVAHTGGRVVDASGLTVMPGLIEYHSHLQKDFGGASGRAYLAFGITTVRSPGGSPYESVEYRESAEAGVRPGPRVYSTGYLLEWNRVYYNMAVAISSNAHLELELQRAKALQHDLIKSYVRMPDLQQKRIIEFAHAAGIPVSSHEVFPSSLSGIDAVEHLGATSRRGYSPKQGPLQRTYSDVIQLLAASGMSITPTIALSGASLRKLGDLDPTFRGDERFTIYPSWLTSSFTTSAPGAVPVPVPGGPPTTDSNGSYAMVMSLMKAGTTILAGTDTPLAANLHGELLTFVAAGMTPFQALQTATVNAARVLGLDAGSIEVGKLADLAIIQGNPLTDITATKNVKHVMANGRVWAVGDLVKP